MTNLIKNQEDLTRLIRGDAWMMKVLVAAEQLNLPDWWIGAGFLRNKVWDYLEGKDSKPTRDVDLVYFDSQDNPKERDWAYDEKMLKKHPFAQWEVRNQARMHYINGFSSFTSTADGIAHWIETATCSAVRLRKGTLEYLFCYGTGDLFNLIARPTPYFEAEASIGKFYSRIEQKQWRQKWPDLRIIGK